MSNTWMNKTRVSCLLVCVLLSMICLKSTEGAVIGIDLGNEFFKGTLVKPGYPFTIVENTASQRKTPTAMAFTGEQRVYGLDAIMQSGSNPDNTFAFVRDILGLEYNEENIELLRNKFYNFNNIVRDERGYVAFEVDLVIDGEKSSFQFTVEEILAMILAHAKTLAEIQSKGSVKNVYLTVPLSFTMNQRRMLNDAVELAGLSCLGMIEENAASAVAYGIDRKDENETHSVLFLNLGSSDFEATIVNYLAKADNITDRFGKTKLGDVIENIDVVAQAYSGEISGRIFDVELMNILAENFNSMESRKSKPDIRENPKIVNRLLKEVPKIKDTLSANKEKILNLVEVADYENLKMTLLRSDFEARIEKYLEFLKETIGQVLEKAKLSMEQLSGVEIIGGALRVPRVKDYLQELVGDHALGTHINGDESMSFGAAFLGANSSTSFKVRKLYMHKYIEEPVYLNITSLNLDPEDENYVKKRFLFYEGIEEGKKKYGTVTVDDLKAEFYTESQGVIHKVLIKGIDEVLQSEEYLTNGTTPKVIFEVSFSPNGYVEVSKVTAKVTQTLMKEVERRVPVNNSTESQETDSQESESTSDKETTEDDSGQSTSESDDTEEILLNDSKNKTKGSGSPQEYRTIIEHVEKNKTHTMKLTYEEEFIGHQPMTTEQKVNAAAHLVDLEKRDKLILDTMKAKNDYEALIYSSRDWVSDEDNQVYTTPEVIEEFLQKLTEGEDWLYEDGYDQKLDVYTDRIQELNDTIQPMKYRQSEHHIRNDVLENTQTMVNNFTQEIDSLQKHFPWIEEFKIERLRGIAKNATEWFEKTLSEQESLQLHEDPALNSGEMREKLYSIIYIMKQLSKTPKPKDWGKKSSKEGTDSAKNSTEGFKTDNSTTADFSDEAEAPEVSFEDENPEEVDESPTEDL